MTASFVTENAGRRLLVEQAEDSDLLTAPQKRTQHLLVALNELKGNENILDLSFDYR
jgi:hypothetical protein